MTAYEKICAEACKWCAKGYSKHGAWNYIPISARAEMSEPCEADVPCTAPERDEVIERLTAEKKTWRCFHCGFETFDDKQAAAHFGDRDDAEEFKPLCRWWQSMTPEERGETLQDAIQQLNEERDSHKAEMERADRVESDLAALKLERDELRAAFREISEFLEGRTIANHNKYNNEKTTTFPTPCHIEP